MARLLNRAVESGIMTTFRAESNERAMSHTLFISDLHLQQHDPISTNAFFYLVETLAPKADQLYILGDFFEVWVGDDDCAQYYEKIKSALKALVLQGTPVFLMRGNRDFLIGERFATETKVQLLKDPSVISLYGRKILLSHGDALCLDDHAHQRYRKLVSKPWLQKIFLGLPLRWRQHIAKKLRIQSQKHYWRHLPEITDVSQSAVVEIMAVNNSNLLIHGHTHRPAIHTLSCNQTTAHRIVLNAWHHGGNYLIYEDNHHYELVDFTTSH